MIANIRLSIDDFEHIAYTATSLSPPTMALPQSQQCHENNGLPWYWDDDQDYDLKEITLEFNHNHRNQLGTKEISLSQTLGYPRTDWRHERHGADSSVLVIVRDDSSEHEKRWSESVGHHLVLTSASTGELCLSMKPSPKQVRCVIPSRPYLGLIFLLSKPVDTPHCES